MKQSRRGSAMLDIVVVVAIIGILAAIIVPMAIMARGRAARAKCANHLCVIGQAMSQYAADNGGRYPSTRPTHGPQVIPDVSNRGAAAPDPFAEDGPGPNNVPSVLFLLVRTELVAPPRLLCPAILGAADPMGGMPATLRSNFTNLKLNLGYSVQNPYANDAALEAGFLWNSRLPSNFPMVADRSPGRPAEADLGLDPRRAWNSENHDREGQNVLYANGSVLLRELPLRRHRRGQHLPQPRRPPARFPRRPPRFPPPPVKLNS